jgi:hypothetical protein
LLPSPQTVIADYFRDSTFWISNKYNSHNNLTCLDGVEKLWAKCLLAQVFHVYPQLSGHFERVRDVLHFDTFFGDQDAYDIELVRLAGASVAVDPDVGAAGEFALFLEVHGFDGITELISAPRFHFDERDGVVAFGDEVDIAMAVAESARENAIAVFDEPSFGDAFAECAELLIVLAHGRQARGDRLLGVTVFLRASAFC